MSKSELQILFDREDRTYHFGEQITGRVILNALGKLTCRRIRMECGWRTNGKGNIDRGLNDYLNLQANETHYSNGEQRVYPSVFTAPNGPVSYHGDYINVDWYLTVQADIPMAPDIMDEEDILLLPGEAPAIIILGDTNLSQIQSPTRRRIPQPDFLVSHNGQQSEPLRDYLADWRKILMILLIISPLVATLILVTGILSYPNWGWSFALAGSLIAFSAGVLIYAGLRVILDIISKRKLDIREIRIEPSEVYTGEQLSCQLQVEAKGAVFLDSIAAILSAEEESVSGGGTYVTTYKHTAYKQSFVKSYTENLIAGRWISFYGLFSIPPSAPATFAASNNKITWSLKLIIRFKGWRSWVKIIPITVLPA